MKCEKCGQTPCGNMKVTVCPGCHATLCSSCFVGMGDGHGCGKPKPDPASNAPVCVCGQQMKIRSGPYGEFYGCKDYPDCQHTEQIDDEYDPCLEDELKFHDHN